MKLACCIMGHDIEELKVPDKSAYILSLATVIESILAAGIRRFFIGLDCGVEQWSALYLARKMVTTRKRIKLIIYKSDNPPFDERTAIVRMLGRSEPADLEFVLKRVTHLFIVDKAVPPYPDHVKCLRLSQEELFALSYLTKQKIRDWLVS